ncbi:Uncharacterised protein [Mycobacteroides abscessus subsp. abscessus]|nr:Uncharacterised protein [Mycobacteroides abscessus subsp. abscessus]SIM56459.1 Uncharacterised protein [Mycobacteroides abscessus subsp. abscessus]
MATNRLSASLTTVSISKGKVAMVPTASSAAENSSAAIAASCPADAAVGSSASGTNAVPMTSIPSTRLRLGPKRAESQPVRRT